MHVEIWIPSILEQKNESEICFMKGKLYLDIFFERK